jgi:hypothetical protein
VTVQSLLDALQVHCFGGKSWQEALRRYKLCSQTNPAVLYASAVCLLGTAGVSCRYTARRRRVPVCTR